MRNWVVVPVGTVVGFLGLSVMTPTVAVSKGDDLPGASEDCSAVVRSEAETLGPVIGPDVIVGAINSVWHWGAIEVAPGEFMSGYSIGTTSCNIGDFRADWVGGLNRHPVIAQNIYRLQNGAIEQIGQSWVKHAFATIDDGICGVCDGQLGQVLGVGCSDPYNFLVNGQQTRLGPKFEVNPFTGVYRWPHTARGWTGNAIFKRAQVRVADVDPALNPTALYFGEGQYVTTDEAAWGTQLNNVSYHQFVRGSGSPTGGYVMIMTGSTQREQPAIQAWADFDPAVTVVDVMVPGEGLLHLGYKVSDNGNGTWHYEYAVHNQNSDRSVGSFHVPNGADATNIGFHDVHYHSGEPFDGTDWPSVLVDGDLMWATEPFEINENANAIRWGTMYNFRFDSPHAPEAGEVEFGLFKPGTPDSIVVTAMVPSAAPRLVGDMNCDGFVSVGDINPFVLALTDAAAYRTQFPDCDELNGDCNDDGTVSIGDINCFVQLVNGG